MDPETTTQPNAAVGQQSQATPQSQPQSQLDPSVVALTKAIGQKENPNYGSPKAYTTPDGTGDGANSYGAYQMTPGFVEKWSQLVLGKPYQSAQQLTPAQQDELAYGAIKTMGTTGDPGYSQLGKLTPQQIASAWNTGDPNAYMDPGYGDEQEPGGVAAYTSTVEENYNKLYPQGSSSNSPAQSTSSSSPSALDLLLGIGTGVGGWLLGQAGNIGKDALEAGGAAVGGAIGDVPGAIVGENVAGGVANDLGLGGNNSNASQSAAPTGGSAPVDNAADTAALDSSIPQAAVASKSLAGAYQQAMQGTIKGRTMLSDPQVQGGIEEASMNGDAPEVDENGVMNFDAAIEKEQGGLGDVHNAVAPMLYAEGAIAPTHEAVQEAIKDFNAKSGYTESDRAEAKQAIEQEAETYNKSYGDGQGNMSLGHFDKMRSETGHGRKWNANESNAKREALKSLSMASRRTVEKHTQHKELYNRAMKKQQRKINAIKVMKMLNKKKAPIHKSFLKSALKSGGKYVGLYLGDKLGGPLGAIMGSMVGDYVTRAADKRYGKTIFESRTMRKGMEELQKTHPEVASVLNEELKKAGIKGIQDRIKKDQSQLKLPEGYKKDVIYGQPYKGGEKRPGLITPSKTPPKDYETAERMKHGGSQYGGIYEKNKEIELAKKAAYHTGKEPAPYRYIQGKRKALIKARVSRPKKYKG